MPNPLSQSPDLEIYKSRAHPAEDAESKHSVLRALTRKFQLGDDVDLADLASRCQPLLTGADMYALCADAWMNALKRTVHVRPRVDPVPYKMETVSPRV